MSIEISGIPYNDPSTDALSYSGRVTWDLETIRSRNGQTELYIAKSSTGQRVDLTRFIKTAIYGKRLSPLLDSGVVAYLNGAFSGTTTLTVHGAQGSAFATGDLIAVVNWFSESTGAANTVVYRKVSSVTATTVVLHGSSRADARSRSAMGIDSNERTYARASSTRIRWSGSRAASSKITRSPAPAAAAATPGTSGVWRRS